MSDEKWKDIGGYEGIYQISNFGRVRNSSMILMKPYTTKRGYLQIRLRKNRIRKNFYVHRLVAEAFLPKQNKEQVNHKDANKTNNYVTNLEWVTGRENVLHAVKMGLIKQPDAISLNESNARKLTDKQVHEIRNLYIRYNHNYGSQALGRKYGVNNKVIWNVVNRKTYKDV